MSRKNSLVNTKKDVADFFATIGTILFITSISMTPSSADSPATGQLLAELPSLEVLLPELKTYEYGEKNDILEAISQHVLAAQSDPTRRQTVAKQLAEFLATDCSMAAKQFLAKQLYLIAKEETLPVLQRLLIEPETADIARYVLERMPSKGAGEVLLRSLSQTKGKERVGIINSLGERREVAAVGTLIGLLSERDPETTTATIMALGKIGTLEAANALLRKKIAVAPALRHVLNDSLLQCAERLLAQGKTQQALQIFSLLFEPSEPAATRAAALLGIVKIQGRGAFPIVISGLNSIDQEVCTAAAQALREIPETPEELPGHLASLHDRALILALNALEDNGNPAVVSNILPYLKSPEPAVQQAAFGIAARWGDKSVVPHLLTIAAHGQEPLQKHFRKAIDRMKGEDIDETIARTLNDSDPTLRCEAASALARRFAHSHTDALLRLAQDPEPKVRAEVFRAVSVLGGPEHLSAVLAQLLQETEDSVRATLVDASVSLAKKCPGASGTQVVLNVLKETKNKPDARIAVLTILGELGNDTALSALRACYRERDPRVKEAALRALAGWPSPTVLSDLDYLSRTAPTPALRTVALRGYIRLLGTPSESKPAKTVHRYAKAFKRATGVDEKRAVIAGLGNLADPESLRLLKKYKKEKELDKDVEEAIRRVEMALTHLSASVNAEKSQLAMDGNLSTFWTTSSNQVPRQWITIDFGRDVTLRGLTLHADDDGKYFPRAYEVVIFRSARDKGKTVAKGEATGSTVEITFEPVSCRVVKIIQTGTADCEWVVSEIEAHTEQK
ncbi:MAG TPA: HEAT repeat domain-containing protein [Candidatus Hydrogenedentes bacterium]|nr:HEAT repeat domain-containing protein [Candidatus Hydrogenedentota bacterium]HOL75568.1 HEAT repeat domain-containing protein [Candidatus Hydrogenedentota bacterium]HPO87007.1 HEAT repeat domain-containing protein [Candidatus Hydrogenedentota bacterium]